MIIVGRPINGISINGNEWLLTKDGNLKKFRNVQAAKSFLMKKGLTHSDWENMTFKNIGGAK